MFSLDRLWLRTADGREYVLCAAHQLWDLPSGVVPESPTECLWRLREATRYGGLSGVRDFVVRLNLMPHCTFLPGEAESERLLERMIEQGQVVGYFSGVVGTGAVGAGGGAGGLPSLAFPAMAGALQGLLAKAAQLPGGKSDHELPPLAQAKSLPSLQNSALDAVPALDAPTTTTLPNDLVSVATQFLGRKPPDLTPRAEIPAAARDTVADGEPTAQAATSATPGNLMPAAANLSDDKAATTANDYAIRIVDEDGKPMPGVEITFGPSAADQTKITDADGWAKTTSAQTSLDVTLKLAKQGGVQA